MATAPRSDQPRPVASLPPLTFTRWLLGVVRRARLVLGVAAVVAAIFVAAAWVLPPTYRAEASFVTNTNRGLRLPGSLSGMAGLAGMAAQAGLGMGGEPSESPAFYLQLIQSRELLTRLLESRFGDPRTPAPADSAALVNLLELKGTTPERRLERGVERLRKLIVLSSDPRTNLVTLQVNLDSPVLAAGVANRTVELVDGFNREQRVSRARAKRAFVQARLEEAERELRRAEDRHRNFLAQNRQIRTSPTLLAEEQRLARRMEEALTLASSLRSEYESARIEEVNDAPVITMVDRAVPPQRPRWPRPAPLAVLALTAGLLCGVLTAGVAVLVSDWARRNHEEAAELRRLLGWRGRRRVRVPEPEPGPARAAADAVPVAAGSGPVAGAAATTRGSLDLG